VLQKRKMLLQAGWPREALLITVVRDKAGDGHAILTVKTDRGEYVLDNQTDAILLWSDTGYRFVKRQSQADRTFGLRSAIRRRRPPPPHRTRQKELRVPVTSHPPRPQTGFARGRCSPGTGRTFLTAAAPAKRGVHSGHKAIMSAVGALTETNCTRDVS